MEASKRIKRMKALRASDAKEKATFREGQLNKIIHSGAQVEDLEQHAGWDIILEEYIEKGLHRRRFLGCRASKLIWMQGFQAALDGLLNFIEKKKADKASAMKALEKEEENVEEVNQRVKGQYL